VKADHTGYADVFDALQRDYRVKLDESIPQLRGFLADFRSGRIEPEKLAELRMLSHQMAGAAGTFGFETVGVAARAVENDVRDINSRGAGVLKKSLLVLIDALCTVDDGQADHLKIAPAPGDKAPESALSRPKLLMAEDDPIVVELLKNLLQHEMDIIFTSDGCGVFDLVKREKPDLILLDDDLPGLTGIEVIEKLQAENDLSEIPVIMLTGNADPRNVLKAIKAGASDYFTKPFEPVKFVNHIRDLLSRRDITILIVDDDASIRSLLSYRFETIGVKCFEARNGIEALEAVRQRTPSLIILDRMMPGMEGGAVLSELQRQDEYKDIPVVILTARSNPEDSLKLLQSGAVEFMSKPFNPEEVVLRVSRILNLAHEE